MAPPAFLTGQEPFPDLEGWRADAALCARQNLKSKETDDIYCGRVLGEIDGLDAGGWTSLLLSPEIFAFLVNEPEQWTWQSLSSALAERQASICPVRPWIWERPGAEFRAVLRAQGEGSRGSSCAAARFIDPESETFSRARGLVQQALQLIRNLAPGFAQDIEATVDRIALVDSKASFRGASGLGFRGMVLLSPDPTWTVSVFAEEIVHESTHCLLDLISIREPLLTGAEAFEPRWDAPFRPDKRPLYGNFHATVVVARLIHLFNALRESGADTAVDWRARAADYAERSIAAVDALAAYQGFSPMARTLLGSFVVPTTRGALQDRSPR